MDATSLRELRPDDPTRTGRYRVEVKIGEGGMGAVFLGRDPGKTRRRGEGGPRGTGRRPRRDARGQHSRPPGLVMTMYHYAAADAVA